MGSPLGQVGSGSQVSDFPLVLRWNDSYGWGPGTEESITPGTVHCCMPNELGLRLVIGGGVSVWVLVFPVDV